MPALTEADIRDALRVCFDPELPVNIVDLGLVQAVRLETDSDAPGVAPRFRVLIDLLRRTADDQREAMLQAQVVNRLSGIYAVSASTVRFADEPHWTSDRMTDEAREQLGLNRKAKPGLIQISLP